MKYKNKLVKSNQNDTTIRRTQNCKKMKLCNLLNLM